MEAFTPTEGPLLGTATPSFHREQEAVETFLVG